MRSYIADSGGTARLIKKLYIADSGGTARFVKKLYMADSGGTAHLVYAPEITGTITAGVDGNLKGYALGSYGSLSGYSGPSGISLEALYDDDSTVMCSIELSGFSSDPGSSYLGSITCNSQTLEGSAATHSYSAGIASWSWSTLFGFSSGDSYPFTVNLY